jgi:hypothetical protein
MEIMKPFRNKGMFFTLAAVLVLALVACGGGDDEADITDVVENTAPVADAGEDQDARVCSTVTLDGTGSSDEDGDDLTYSWTLSSLPSGSLSDLSDSSSSSPTFNADAAGTYIARLTVNDGIANSAADTVNVTVSEPATTVSFSSEIQPIFDTNCTTCHAVAFAGTDASFLPLTSDVSYDNLVHERSTRTSDVDDGFDSIFLVRRCDSANSVLFQRVDVTRTGLADSETTMPPTINISQDDQDSIMTWIDEGALNN